MSVKYKQLKNGTLKLIGKPVSDYTNYWGVEGRSTLTEQRYNVHGLTYNGMTKAESVLQYAKGKSILEIGCAPAALLKLAKEIGYDAEGIEPDWHYIEGMQNYSGCKIYQGYFPLKIHKKYDTIIAMDVFEHIKDGQEFVDACRSLLNPDGVIIFMLPLIVDGIVNEDMKHPEHVWLYSDKHIKEWLNPIVIDRWLEGHDIIVFK